MSLGAPPRPLRFLILVVAGWAGVRVAMLLPDGPIAGPPPAVATELPRAPAGGPLPELTTQLPTQAVLPESTKRFTDPLATTLRLRGSPDLSSPGAVGADTSPALAPSWQPFPRAPAFVSVFPPAPSPSLDVPESRGRWSGSAWLLARKEGGGSALAPGGTLGGGQAGARLLYRLNRDPARPLALAARISTPLRGTEQAEVALGIEWRPLRAVPVAVLAERREAIGSEGRSAFALVVHGGGSAALPRGWRVDGYGQAGLVSLRERDLFVDGAVRVGRRLGPLEIGAAAWGGVQPGAARLDVGPSLSLPLEGGRMRLTADWRWRVAGDAEPGSGPALTLAADF